MVARVLKPWPADAVMVIAANAGEENRANMEGVVHVRCRDCDRLLAADTYTVRAAWALPSRRGRPVKFFCVLCHAGHDVRQCSEIYDHTKKGA